MRKIRHFLSIFYLQSYNSLKMNNLQLIIATKDIYFIYIEEKVSKKLINKKVVRCSKFGSNYFLYKLLCFRELSYKGNR